MLSWLCCIRFVFFFFKEKTAYEMRISDWSSDVCSSDLQAQEQPSQLRFVQIVEGPHRAPVIGTAGDLRCRIQRQLAIAGLRQCQAGESRRDREVGRASCRGREGRYV